MKNFPDGTKIFDNFFKNTQIVVSTRLMATAVKKPMSTVLELFYMKFLFEKDLSIRT